ncbi:MAG: hypothetical protein AAF629_09380 [Chloroflexota bacterium]
MNKEEILQLNVIPDGQEAWLNYDQVEDLKEIFDQVEIPSGDTHQINDGYLQLFDFLTNIADISVPLNEAAIHFNAFALIRRGYKVEDITSEEYQHLLRLMTDADQTHIDDMDLYVSGSHRDLYTYLTQNMGLPVKAGRGPVWHRTKALIEKYERLDD